MSGVQRGPLFQAAVILILGGLLGWGLFSQLDDTLYSARYSSGWALAAIVAAVVCLWWSTPRERAGLGRRLRIQTILATLIVAGFLVHAEQRLPLGWIETGLFALAIAFLASAVLGFALLREIENAPEPEASDARLARWIRIHAGLVGALFGLALFHGVFVHAHGWLAHLFLYGE